MLNIADESSDARLHSLIEKSQAGQWSASQKIDWQNPVVLPASVSPQTYIDMVSQLYHAEVATLDMIARMLRELPELAARWYLCTQAADEARHAQVYRAYLERLGDIAPSHPGLRAVFDAALEFDGPSFGLVVALNLIMETEALNQQKLRIATLPCPLFLQINKAIVLDEARHASFGVIYLKKKLMTVCPEEKRQVLGWIGMLWKLWLAANQGRYQLAGEEVLRVDAGALDERWTRVSRSLDAIGLTV